VESLKEQLEHTQQELAKSHDSNRDLKTKLQTVVREKDSTQVRFTFLLFGYFSGYDTTLLEHTLSLSSRHFGR